MYEVVSERSRVLLWKHAGEWYAAGLFLLYAVMLLAHHSAPALCDYNDWTYEGVLLKNQMLGLPDPAHVLKHYPVPNSIGTIGIALLSLVFSWQIAAKLWLCVQLAVSFFTMRHMMRTCRSDVALWFVIPTAVFLNTNLWYGFVNFQLGLCWAILMASLLLRQEQREWMFGVLLILAFLTHMIPFAFAGLLLVLYVIQSRRTRLLWQLVPSAFLSAWYVVGRYLAANDADGQAGMVSPVRTYSAAFWAYKGNTYLKSFGFINPTDATGSVAARVVGPVVFVLSEVANIVLCLIIGWFLIQGAIKAYRERRAERFVWTAALIFGPLYLLVPGVALGVSDPGSRLLQTLLAVVIFLCVTEGRRGKGAIRLAGACATLLAIVAATLFYEVIFTTQRQTGTVVPHLPNAVATLAHVPTHTKWYYYTALERGDMNLAVFPTAMFLNTADARSPLD
jgi:hypothetical protein